LLKKGHAKQSSFGWAQEVVRLILVVFLIYCLFYVACEKGSNRACVLNPITESPVYQQHVAPVFAATEKLARQVVSQVDDIALASGFYGVSKPLFERFEKVKKSAEWIKTEKLVFDNLDRFKNTWHKAAVIFVDESLPWFLKSAEQVLDWINKHIMPTVKTYTAIIAKSIRKAILSASPSFWKVYESVLAYLNQTLSVIFKFTHAKYTDLINGIHQVDSIKSFLKSPHYQSATSFAAKQFEPIAKHGSNVFELTQQAASYYLTMSQHILGASLDFMWRILEGQVTDQEYDLVWQHLTTLNKVNGYQAQDKPIRKEPKIVRNEL